MIIKHLIIQKKPGKENLCTISKLSSANFDRERFWCMGAAQFPWKKKLQQLTQCAG